MVDAVDDVIVAGSAFSSHDHTLGVVAIKYADPVSTITSIDAVTPSPSLIGDAVVMSVSVSAGAEIPGGQVTVTADTGERCDITLNAGTGSCSLTFNSVGVRNLTATYGGHSVYTSSDSAPVQHEVLPAADLSVSVTNYQENVGPGTTTVYTLVASNDGPSFSQGVLNVTQPGVLSCSWTSQVNNGATGNSGTATGDLTEALNLPAGSFVTYVGTCAVDATATGSLVFSAIINNGQVADQNPANNSATDTDTLLPMHAELSLSVSTSLVEPQAVATPFYYRFDVENSGINDAPNLRLTLTTPANYRGIVVTGGSGWSCDGNVTPLVCSKGQLNVGDATTLWVEMDAPDLGYPYELAMDAVISSDLADPVNENNQVALGTLVGTVDASCSGVDAILPQATQVVNPVICTGTSSVTVAADVSVYQNGTLFILSPSVTIQEDFHVQKGNILSINPL
jgi:hypothetical protein